MSAPASLVTRVASALGLTPGACTSVSGGSINATFRLETSVGPVFVKHHSAPPRTASGIGFFAAEADGIARLAVAVTVPRVLAVMEDALVLEWIPPGPRARASEEVAGRALARLHAQHGERFGLDADNFMGALPQDNRAPSRPDFVTFFRERRLEPLAHHLPSRLRQRLERLPLDALLTEPPAPSLVHGDLWSGNLYHGARGPVFIDPAVAYGHPEQDLAMTRLFGGFSEHFYAAYREASGQVFDRALEERLELLNLYPLLVHVALFGGHYVHEVEAILARHSG